jgi:hypothetical protein
LCFWWGSFLLPDIYDGPVFICSREEENRLDERRGRSYT